MIPEEFGNMNIIDAYKGFRKINVEINSELVRELPKPAILRMGKELGVVKKGLLNCSQQEMDIFMDYCLYTFRPKGKTLPQIRSEQTDKDENFPLHLMLLGMASAFFSIFAVEDIKRGNGLVLRDILNQNSIPLIDVNLSRTAKKGMQLAGRLLQLPGFYMTSGAMFIMEEKFIENHLTPILKQIHESISKGKIKTKADIEKAFSKKLIRAALKENVLENMAFR